MPGKIFNLFFSFQFAKFVVVGVINTAIDLGVLNILIFGSGLGKSGGIYYAIFKSLSFLAAVINSYFLNKYWTFRARNLESSAAMQVSQFLIISVVGWFINVGIASFVATYFIPPFSFLVNLWPSISALFGTALGLIWNFLGYKFIVFKK